MGIGHMSVGLMSSQRMSSTLDLEPPKHGGDLAYWQRKVGDKALNWLDLSSACNREPWPIPQMDSSLWMDLPDQVTLLDVAEGYYGCRPIAIGAGSQHIIESLPILLREFKPLCDLRVVVPRVGYQEHAFAWKNGVMNLLIMTCWKSCLSRTLRSPWSFSQTIQRENGRQRLRYRR